MTAILIEEHISSEELQDSVMNLYDVTKTWKIPQ